MPRVDCEPTSADVFQDHPLPFPPVSTEQIACYTKEALRAAPAGPFKPQEAAFVLSQNAGRRIVAVDAGGTKVDVATGYVENGRIVFDGNNATFDVECGGKNIPNIFASLRQAYPDSAIGLSVAGVVRDNRFLSDSPNLTGLTGTLSGNGDLHEVLGPNLVVYNDAVAGALCAGLSAHQSGVTSDHLVYGIFGSGFGGAGISAGQLWSAEPGHIPVVFEYNPLGVSRPCNPQVGRQYTCVERVAAMKAGVEETWFQKYGEQKTGQQISELALRGDKRAISILSTFAYIIAAGMIGTMQVLGMNPATSAVVLHGGGTRVPGMTRRIGTLINAHYEDKLSVPVLSTQEIGVEGNACLLGAAYGAALMHSPQISGTIY